MKSFAWRAALVGLVIAVAVVLIMPSVDFYRRSDTSRGLKDQDTIWPHRIINLGLDLQGGMFLVLTVEAEKAVDSAMGRKVDDIREELRDAHIRYKDLERKEDGTIVITLLGDKAINDFQKLLDEEFPELSVSDRKNEGENQSMILALPEKDKELIANDAVDRALEIIRTRVDTLGVSEPEIRKQGDRRILIQLPGIADPERAKDLLGKTALLEFKLVDDANKGAKSVNLPPGTELLALERRNQETGRVSKENILVKKRTMMTGEYITEVRVRTDSEFGMPYVALKFDKRGSVLFEHITEENEGKQLAIVLDGVVKSAPVIREKISGGEAIIEGDFTLEEARDLAIVLRTSLPAPVEILEERTVGPSLGRDSISSGFMAAAVGLSLVVLFMVVYYMGAGIAADLALLLNILLIGAGLAIFEATLTLPGIAGIILTIGMAVDANVLIYERIREELRTGKTPAAAVDAGYGRATVTIFDANVTTLIAALVLFQFGTGPIKGFAVTLSLGIISSMFTAIVVSRVIFDYFLFYRRVQKLSI